MNDRLTNNRVLNTWAFNGVRLASFGALTELDSYLDIPAKRGANIAIPFKHGTEHVDKYFDEKTVDFGLEVIAGNIPDLETKFDALRALLAVKQRKYLSYISSAGIRQALAEVVMPITPTRDGDALVAKVVISFLLAEPFFRNVVKTTRGPYTIDASPKALTVNNPGSAEECKSIITLVGPLSHPIITNGTVVLQYDDDLAGAGNTVTIDCDAFTAVDETATSVIDKIVHSGDPAFMVLYPGDNSISVTDGTHTTGTIQFDFYAPYL